MSDELFTALPIPPTTVKVSPGAVRWSWWIDIYMGWAYTRRHHWGTREKAMAKGIRVVDRRRAEKRRNDALTIERNIE